MGLLDMLFGGDGQPQQNSLPMEELRQLGLSDGLINYYQQEQAKAQKAQMWNNAINGIANITSSAQGMGARFGGGGDGGGGASGPGANTPLGLDGLVDRALKFSQVREGIAKQKQAAEARAAIPALAAKLGVPAEVVAAMDPSDLSKMYQQVQEADLKAKAPIRQEDAAFDAAGIPPEQRQAIRARAYASKPEQVTIDLPQGKITALKVTDASGMPRYTRLDGTPLDMNAVTQEFSQVEAARESTKAQAKAQGEKRAGLETTLSNIDEMNMNVQQVLDDPKLAGSVGAIWNRGMSFIPGTDEYGVAQRIEQLKSKSFLSSIAQMRGMGSLSNAEGAKVESALGRLNAAQNEKDFRQSLADVQKSLTRLRDVAIREAGVASPSSISQTASDWTDLGNGIKFRKVN